MDDKLKRRTRKRGRPVIIGNLMDCLIDELLVAYQARQARAERLLRKIPLLEGQPLSEFQKCWQDIDSEKMHATAGSIE